MQQHHTLKSDHSGHYYIFSTAQTESGRVKVTYLRPEPFHCVGHWKSGDDARAQYRRLRSAGFTPAAMPAAMLSANYAGLEI